ncbi:MAG TPA: hypothetical protein VJ385_22080, partial [Fibrobacteria bacterium]|nr:hypothetical protein [Fibrobacteria bacterium]
VEYSGQFLGPIPNIVVFQFNPEEIQRTLRIPENHAGEPVDRARQQGNGQTSAPPVETFSLTLHFSAADDLGKGGAASAIPRVFGIGPQLAALEKMVYPAGPLTGILGAALDAVGSALGGGSAPAAENPVPMESLPRLLFIWGPTRVLPVAIQSMSITEKQYDALLNPIQAQVQIGLAVASLPASSTDVIGKGALTYTQVVKDTQSILNLAKAAELALDIIPF